MRILAALLCVGLAGCAGIQHARDTALHIGISGDTSCSATVIGPHAIISAAHCFDWPYTLTIHGQPVAVKRVMLDGHDHIILFVGMRFGTWSQHAHFGTQGDPVYIIGNPGDLTEQFRHGYIAGQIAVRGELADSYDLRIFPGDSGSGIFDASGRLIGVVSFIYTMENETGQLTIAGSFPMAFTAKQWREAEQ